MAVLTAENSVDELVRDIKDLQMFSTRYRAQFLDAVGRFDEAQMAEAYGESSTTKWLIRELNLAGSTAFEYVRMGRGLRQFRQLFSAFEDGDLAYSTVRFLLRFMTLENEDDLVALAKSMCFSELQQTLAGAGDVGREPDDPYVRTRTRDDGMVEFHALLPAVTGQETLAALKLAQLCNYGIPDDAGDLDQDDIDRLLGEALADEETCPAEQIAAPDTKLSVEKILGMTSRFGPPTKDELYPAFLAMVNIVRSQPLDSLRCPGAQVNIMVTEDGRAWMPENPSAPSETVKGYVANAVARLHVLDRKGLTLNVGRKQRFATDGQIQALLAVWGYQCAMPGCTHERFIQIHHIEEWEHGGATDLANLIPLCSSCHSKINHGTAYVEAAGSDLYFKFSDGSQYISRNRCLPVRTANFTGPMRPSIRVEGDSFSDDIVADVNWS